MAKKSEKTERRMILHKEGAEWLTQEICEYYKEKAKNIRNRSISDIEFKGLCKELVERCDITEVQAVNILNGYYINDYVAMYERMRDPAGVTNSGNTDTKEYLEWLAQKEERENTLSDYGLVNPD